MKIGNFSIWLSPSRAGVRPASLDCEDLGNTLVAQLGQAHRVEQLTDRRLELLHGPLEVTVHFLRTRAAVQAAHDTDRSLERADHLADRDVRGVTRQQIPTLGAVLAHDEPPLRQALQDLREQLGRDPELLGDPLRADGAEAVMRGDVVDRHQPVVGALRKAEHCSSPRVLPEHLVIARPYLRLFLSATLSVAFSHHRGPASTRKGWSD